MVDMRQTIIAKSDQMNADDLVGGPRTIKITKVSAMTEKDQPIGVYFEGDEGKPYKPCKTMRRLMVHVWGPDAARYVGKSMTVYREGKVKWGGMEVGGIRISNMSDIDGPITVALRETKQNSRPITVKPLAQPSQTRQEPSFDIAAWSDQIIDRLQSYATLDDLRADWDPHKAELKQRDPERFKTVNQAVSARGGELSMAE